MGMSGRKSFADIVDLICEKHEPQERNLERDEDFLRLEQWQRRGDTCYGILLRLRPNHHAVMAQLEQEGLKDVPVPAGHHPAEYACFRYTPQNNILVMQSNPAAGGPSRLCWYVREMSGDQHIGHDIVLTPDAARNYRNLQIISAVELSLAAPSQAGLFDGSGETLEHVLAFGQDTDAARMRIRLSSGHRAHGLNLKFIRDMISQLQTVSLETKIARVNGYDAADEKRVVDLIEDRLRETVELTCTGPVPTVKDRFRALDKAYSSRRDDLDRLFAKGDQQ
jgi:hypothetical protein